MQASPIWEMGTVAWEVGSTCEFHQEGVARQQACCGPRTSMNQLSTWAPCVLAGVALRVPGVRVSGSDPMPLSLAAGSLCEGQHPAESSAAQLHPSKFPGGGHGGFSGRARHFFLCSGEGQGSGVVWQGCVLQRAALLAARAGVSNVVLASSDGTSVSLPRKESFMRSSLLIQMKCLSRHQKLQSKMLR